MRMTVPQLGLVSSPKICKIKAKTVTVALSAKEAELFAQAIKHHRRLEKLIDQMQLVSRRHLLPEITEAILRPPFECLGVEFKRMLDVVDRFHATGEALEECGRLVQTLEIQRYWGDFSP
jgi:hypothetical protein